jgi:CRISPR/Cas system-associated exonuclease Cas4 (RecB family)
MIRFDREFHQSDFEKFKLCPRMLYYVAVLGIEAEKTSELAIAGTAIHETILKAHTEKLWEEKKLFDFWQEDFEKRVAVAISANTEVTRETVDPEDYRQMLRGYLAKPWNREAEVLLAEKEFFFEVKPNSTIYQFAGRIDQVIRVSREALVRDFPLFEDFPNLKVTIHRDMKTGQRKGTTPFELMLNDQISIYAYALKYGNFDLDHDGICETHLDFMPDFHALYFLKDHIPYKRPPKDKSIRGPAMYFTRRPLERLRNIPRELMPVCANIRRGDFPREGVVRGLCEKHCSVRHYCEADLLQEVT